MEKRNKIIYWIATLWLSLGMTATAIVQILRTPDEIERMNTLGYPVYLLTIVAIWKLLGVVTVLLPNFLLLKEWAYVGFFFLVSGAVISHLAVGDNPAELFGPSLLLILTIVSWHFRPVNRRIITKNKFVL